MKRTAALRRPKRGASGTAANILDAAENLFATRGYHGTSIRDITQAAGAQLALASYHFGSKQSLYNQVIRRRGPEHAAEMQRFLDAVIDAARPGEASVEAIVEAFCASIFKRIVDGGPGWRRYIQLLSRVADAPQEEGFVTPMNEIFDPVVGNYIRAFRAILPSMKSANLYSAFYFLQAGLVYVTADTGGIDRQSAGILHSSDFKKLLPRMVQFFAAGFRSLDEIPASRAKGQSFRGARRAPSLRPAARRNAPRIRT